ncbi:MAG: sialidase family protein [Candidatus Latescibacteria bacterium]|nr:hypothetical protein [Gemmatimonadaceae bacterium]MDP6018321.1 sialidase family protein [Candidatus Latescibacterota bacterium]
MKPVCVAQFDERPRVAQLPDGSLQAVCIPAASEQAVVARSSHDGGRTWSDPETLFALSMDHGRWGGWETLVDRDGNCICS